MDRLTGLRVFVTAVDQGSMAAAARALGMTPAMAGKHVAAIEASLGVRLLHRTTRRLRLTQAGQDYHRRSRAILDAYEDAGRAAAALQEEPRGIIRMTAPTTFGALQLGPPIADFVRRHPGVVVEMELKDRQVDLVADGFDLAVRIGNLADSSMVARRIARTRMMACAAPAYLDEKGRPSSPSSLRHFDRLAFSLATSAGDWSFTDGQGRVHEVDGPVRVRADNVQMLLAAALSGAGIVYGPSFALGEHVRNGTLEQVLPDYSTAALDIYAVYPSARLVAVSVRRLVERLQAWFGKQERWD